MISFMKLCFPLFKLDFWISSCWENLYSGLHVVNISEFTMISTLKRMPNVLTHIGFSYEILEAFKSYLKQKNLSDLDDFSHNDRFWWPHIHQKKLFWSSTLQEANLFTWLLWFICIIYMTESQKNQIDLCALVGFSK